MRGEIPQILIVDNEILVAIDAEYILKSQLHCHVTIAGPHMLENLSAPLWNNIAAVILDIHPRDAGAFDLARQLRRRGIPLVFVTASTCYDRHVPGFEGVPVVSKPYALEAASREESLVAAVRSVLAD